MFAVAQLSDLAHGLLISNSVKFSQLYLREQVTSSKHLQGKFEQ